MSSTSKALTYSSHPPDPPLHHQKVAGLLPGLTMSPHSLLCRRLTWHLCRARRQLERRANGPPAMRTRSRTSTTSPPSQVTPATPNTPADRTGTLTKKPPTKKQLLASSKRLGRKRLALKRVLEKKKKEMDEKGKRTFGMGQRIRLLSQLGLAGELEEGRRLVPAQRKITSPEAMRAKREGKRVGRSPLGEMW